MQNKTEPDLQRRKRTLLAKTLAKIMAEIIVAKRRSGTSNAKKEVAN
jgi:hypothetical protein